MDEIRAARQRIAERVKTRIAMAVNAAAKMAITRDRRREQLALGAVRAAAGTAGTRQRCRGGNRRAPHKPFAVAGFTVAGGRIVAIDLIIDPDKLRGLAVGE